MPAIVLVGRLTQRLGIDVLISASFTSSICVWLSSVPFLLQWHIAEARWAAFRCDSFSWRLPLTDDADTADLLLHDWAKVVNQQRADEHTGASPMQQHALIPEARQCVEVRAQMRFKTEWSWTRRSNLDGSATFDKADMQTNKSPLEIQNQHLQWLPVTILTLTPHPQARECSSVLSKSRFESYFRLHSIVEQIIQRDLEAFQSIHLTATVLFRELFSYRIHSYFLRCWSWPEVDVVMVMIVHNWVKHLQVLENFNQVFRRGRIVECDCARNIEHAQATDPWHTLAIHKLLYHEIRKRWIWERENILNGTYSLEWQLNVACYVLSSDLLGQTREKKRRTHLTFISINEQLTSWVTRKEKPTNERKKNYGACPPSLSLEMADITSPPPRKFFERSEKNFEPRKHTTQRKHNK